MAISSLRGPAASVALQVSGFMAACMRGFPQYSSETCPDGHTENACTRDPTASETYTNTGAVEEIIWPRVLNSSVVGVIQKLTLAGSVTVSATLATGHVPATS